jgi:hypothetical protein
MRSRKGRVAETEAAEMESRKAVMGERSECLRIEVWSVDNENDGMDSRIQQMP